MSQRKKMSKRETAERGKLRSHGLQELWKKELERLMNWVSERVRQGDIVRTSDVVRYYKENENVDWKDIYQIPPGKSKTRRLLSQKDIAEALRLHPVYMMSSSQQRGPRWQRRHRAIITNSLGNLHADLGFEPLRRHYGTPKRYRSGYLVAKDVLSRFTYVVILRGSKSADSLIGALKELIKKHESIFPGGHRILSISFDRETSVMSNKVQQFLRANKISFHPFMFTSSKSKHAEGAIKLIRKTLARFEVDRPGVPWWKLMDDVVNSLNYNFIVVDGKRLKFRPADVNKFNLKEFVGQLQKAKPGYFFGQFNLDPRSIQFKFSLGDLVRPKLLAISSAVVGEKRSAQSLADTTFVVDEQIAYPDQKHRVGKAYHCINVQTGEKQTFDEKDIALTREIERARTDWTLGEEEEEEENFLPRLRSTKK
jgi:hypothetical protein